MITDIDLAIDISNDPEKSPAAPGGHTAGKVVARPASETRDAVRDGQARWEMRNGRAGNE
jgi:hypothetical protein